MPKLRALDGALRGRDFPLAPQHTTTVGRRSECDLPVNHPKISRNHAELFFDADGQALLRDLRSANGTFVNGIPCQPLEPYPIHPGDEIRFGGVSFRYFTDTRLPDVAIPGHELLDVIAEGGMGTIYLARQTAMARDVAVKILNPAYASRAEFVERFIQEARSAGRLNHPNIIQVHNVGKTEDDAYYFTMELVRGHNLTQRMAHPEGLPLAEIVRAGARIADALQYAHEQGIVHRDIKPDNIMIADSGEVKLADLGIAKTDELDEDANAPKRVLGTPHYMSPEQACARPVDARSDLYSLGATLYHAIAGRPVFEALTPADVMKMHVHQLPRPLAEAAPDTPPDLCGIIDRLLAKNPDDRYPDAAAVAAALDECAVRLGVDTPREAAPRAAAALLRDAALAPLDDDEFDVPTFEADAAARRGRYLAIGAVLALLVAAGVWWAARDAVEDDPPIVRPPTENNGADTASSSTAGQADRQLDSLEALADQSDWENAARLVVELRARPGVGTAWQRRFAFAEKRVADGLTRQREAAAWDEAWTRGYENRARQTPPDFTALDTELATLRKKFPGRLAVLDAEAERLAALERQHASRLVDQFTRELDDAVLRHRYDDALAALARFEKEQPRHVNAARVPARRVDITRAAHDAAQKARGLIAAAKDKPAEIVAVVDRFNRDTQFAPARAEFAPLAEAARKKVEAAMAESLNESRALVADLAFGRAENVWNRRRAEWTGSPFEARAEAYRADVDAARKIHEAFIKAASVRSWKAPDDFPVAALAGETVVGAAPKGVSVRRALGQMTVLWEKIPPKERVVLYRQFLAEDSPERPLVDRYAAFIGD